MDKYGKPDCAPCRLIGGLGFLGIGCYVGLVGTRSSKSTFSRFAVATIGLGFAGIGIARLLGISPFSGKKKIVSSDNT